jgi:hypothetical protein
LADSRSQVLPGSELEPQARLERSPLVRAVLSVVVVLFIAGLLQTNLRPSYLKGKLGDVTAGYVNAVGLDQDWALFAPEPRKFTLDLAATVKYADGTSGFWTTPRGGKLLGGYWDYRWLKWTEYAVDEGHKDLWQPAAAFVARDAAKPGNPVAKVTLLRRETPNNPPGQKVLTGTRSVVPYYTYVVKGVGG